MPQAPRHLWLVRHGARLDVAHPEWLKTAERPHDTPLAPDGLIQADEVGRRLRSEGIHHLFVSPFLRALETADRIANALDLPMRVEHGLCEAYYPQWFPINPTFMPREEMVKRFPRVDQAYVSAVTPAYPEDKEGLKSRTARVVQELTRRYEGNLLLVSHGGAISSLCASLVANGNSVHAACCCLIQLSERDALWTLTRDGRDTSHLSLTESVLRFA